MTDATSQEDLFGNLELLLSEAEQCPSGSLIICALIFQHCSIEQEQRVRPCRQFCIDTFLACNVSSDLEALCNTFPVGATPDQEMCPYGEYSVYLINYLLAL